MVPSPQELQAASTATSIDDLTQQQQHETGAYGDETYPQVIERFLTQEKIDEFMRNGVVVIPNVLTPEEVTAARNGLHAELAKYGVDPNDLEATGENLKKLSSTGGAGGILDLFYPSWRLRVAENDKVFAAMSDLWSATYAQNHPDFQHPHGDFNGKQGFMYINRVCYRVPDTISKMHGAKKSRPMQRSLTPHLDCCPSDPFNSGKEIPRWRPIQCITVLTDNLEKNTGGFEAVRGFHKEFVAYFAEQNRRALEQDDGRPQVCLGDFSPLRMQEDRDVINRYEHVSCEAGSVIFFDWRIPHANSYKHTGCVPREVVYTGFLPDVELNRAYIQEQLRRYRLRLLPADHWQKSQGDQRVEEQFSEHHFSSLGSRLIGLHPCLRKSAAPAKKTGAFPHSSHSRFTTPRSKQRKQASRQTDMTKPAEDASKGKRKIDDFFTKKPADASAAEESSASVNGKGKASAAAAKSSKKKKEEASEEEDDDEGDDEEDEDGEGSDDGEGGSDDDDDDDDENDEDRAPKSKKRRTKGSDESGSDSESDPEVKLNEDDFIGLDTSNIIPRARRRAAVAAMAKPMELPAGANKGGDDDDDESSDEAEF